MSLRVKATKKIILRSLSALLLIAFVAVIAVVMINEKRMADDRANQPPAAETPAAPEVEEEILDETPITEEQVAEWTVAKDKPRYLSVPKIGVTKARVVEIGKKSNGQINSPVSIYDAGWYRNSAKPGTGGVIFLDGHNGGTRREGIFDNLNSLKAGDELIIERGDGALFTYKVVENNIIPLDEADSHMNTMLNKSAVAGKEGLNIITCIGDWNENLKTYNKRVMLRAVLEN